MWKVFNQLKELLDTEIIKNTAELKEERGDIKVIWN